jgi:hypothetical protein
MGCKIVIGPLIGPAKIGSCLGPALWAEVAAQALSTYRAGPALSTINRRAVLFRAVPRAANRDRPIWNTIITVHVSYNIFLIPRNTLAFCTHLWNKDVWCDTSIAGLLSQCCPYVITVLFLATYIPWVRPTRKGQSYFLIPVLEGIILYAPAKNKTSQSHTWLSEKR